ncbi:hypothetical protein [Streptomyces longispororuber]|uniref:hypothetical protein n=1 Tax=Streptomyces longispororuber TaxID=68230 RepID=UPI00210B9D08|nr:hypothetical protein [Streptomyces longispororuber]MCQ4213526.1 hypothetical protein [Streptomyces longispororuber]
MTDNSSPPVDGAPSVDSAPSDAVGPFAPAPVGALLAAAVRPDAPDADGEVRALAAFRAARDAGAFTAPTRRRDDWRPRRRRGRWSLRAAVGAVVATVAVGGVAVAGIGTVSSTDEPDQRPRPSRTVLPSPAAAEPSAPAPSERAPRAGRSRPGQAKDQQARCKSYEAGHGLNRSERAAEGCAEPSRTAAVEPAATQRSPQGPGKTPPGKARGTS